MARESEREKKWERERERERKSPAYVSSKSDVQTMSFGRSYFCVAKRPKTDVVRTSQKWPISDNKNLRRNDVVSLLPCWLKLKFSKLSHVAFRWQKRRRCDVGHRPKSEVAFVTSFGCQFCNPGATIFSGNGRHLRKWNGSRFKFCENFEILEVRRWISTYIGKFYMESIALHIWKGTCRDMGYSNMYEYQGYLFRRGLRTLDYVAQAS